MQRKVSDIIIIRTGFTVTFHVSTCIYILCNCNTWLLNSFLAHIYSCLVLLILSVWSCLNRVWFLLYKVCEWLNLDLVFSAADNLLLS